MRVLFLSQIVPYPPHGGVLQRGYHILRQLGQRAGVHLLAFVHPDELPTPDAVEDSRRALQEFCEEVEYFPLWAKGSAVNRAAALAAGLASPRPFSTVAHRSPAFQARVDGLLGSGRFQMVHVDTIALNRFLRKRPAVPAVLTHHNIESMLLERRAAVEARAVPKWILERESRKLAAYERLVAPLYDLNLMMSVPDARLLAERAPGARTAIVPNGVDTDYFTADDGRDETPAVIYTGGMNMLANRDAVLHFLDAIWPSIVEQVPETRFFAVGQDPPADLRAFAERDPRVVVTGKVPDIRPYVRQAAVYVVPIRVGGGTRLKVLDAMASGKAIVSTSIGCEGIDVEPGEHLQVADQPAAFAAATVSLLRDEPRRRALGQKARALVERRYAWPVVGDMLMAAYAEAATARPGRPRATSQPPLTGVGA
jgi:sugar transferase (PEP-CTERM/EpsH1 system associated)